MNTSVDERTIRNHIKFAILLTLDILAIILYLLIFSYFMTHRELLKTPQNRALCILLSVTFLIASCELPMVIHFYYFGRIIIASGTFCTWWIFIGSTLNVSGEFIMTTISIQRHMLIFNSHILRIRKKCFLLHDLPLLLSVACPMLYYVGIIWIYPCGDIELDFSSLYCGWGVCYLVYNKVLSTIDWVITNGIPVVIIMLANILLIVRVVWQKRRRHQPISWQKQRRMTLQLLTISCLYIFTWLPNTIMAVIEQITQSSFVGQIHLNYIVDLVYLVCLLMPWICVGLIPGFKKWMLERTYRLLKLHNAVAPVVVVVGP